MFDKLIDAVTNMKENEALSLTQELLDNNADPVQLLDACTRAMEIVGKKFESGVYFLPELMMAGEILKQISGKVKPMIQDQAEGEKVGRVIMGTVLGDIHDIGKDIVIFLLEVNGFEVYDIGIDVPPEKFVAEIKAFKPQVVGMSGLLTLAFDSMKDTVTAISDAGLREDVKIIIGGGQMSDKISAYAGADACAKDAMDGINIIKEWTRKV
ncbi:cobalamin-dependent protein [Desulfobacula sp.]|uniref:cobalamin B12-binding domain-containing protein n=1 Tax=Desulfobacula sp. TaxID=2593537 RepID=UPI002638B466|nr:cobalamin-dependent protein [Desulfobacula sp.]